MKPLSSLLLIATSMLLTAPVLAANTITCNGDSGQIQCITAQGPSAPDTFDGYLVDVQQDGFDSGPFCFLAPGSWWEMDNQAAAQEIADGVLKIGNNTMSFYECQSADCSQKTALGTYNFTVSQSGDNTYDVHPPFYQFNYTSNGVPCNWDSSRLAGTKLFNIHR